MKSTDAHGSASQSVDAGVCLDQTSGTNIVQDTSIFRAKCD